MFIDTQYCVDHIDVIPRIPDVSKFSKLVPLEIQKITQISLGVQKWPIWEVAQAPRCTKRVFFQQIYGFCEFEVETRQIQIGSFVKTKEKERIT